MILAKNEKYSLHKMDPDTYSHETYILVEKYLKFTEYDYFVTLLSIPKGNMDRLNKLIRSIENGANGSNVELYPLHFVCGSFPKHNSCPANERATALKELRLALAEEKEQNLV
jgi:hypothetical protein